MNDIGFWIADSPTIDVAMPQITINDIVSPFGSYIDSNGFLNNVETTITINSKPLWSIKKTASQLIDELSNKFLSVDGIYKKYQDTLFPDRYAFAICTEISEVTISTFTVSAKVTFSRKGYWLTLSGAIPINGTITEKRANISLNNESSLIAYPKITISAEAGTSINLYNTKSSIEVRIKFSSAYTTCIIDSENSTVTNAQGSRFIDVSFNYFPEIIPGASIFTVSGKVTAFSIIPNWRCL